MYVLCIDCVYCVFPNKWYEESTFMMDEVRRKFEIYLMQSENDDKFNNKKTDKVKRQKVTCSRDYAIGPSTRDQSRCS